VRYETLCTYETGHHLIAKWQKLQAGTVWYSKRFRRGRPARSYTCPVFNWFVLKWQLDTSRRIKVL